MLHLRGVVPPGQCDIGHDFGQLVVLASAGQEFNHHSRMRDPDFFNQSWQVFPRVFANPKKNREYSYLAGSGSYQSGRCFGE